MGCVEQFASKPKELGGAEGLCETVCDHIMSADVFRGDLFCFI